MDRRIGTETALWASVVAVTLSAALIAIAPWPLAFAAAVAAAGGWCRWLDAHPEI
jgi:hypothetical protein